MSQADDRLYVRAIGRMLQTMIWLGAAGVVVACLGWGWRAGIGYGLGAAASYAMFRWLHHAVEALSGKPTRRRILVLAALRYLLLGLGLYVIFMFSRISLMAALAGLFVSTAAAIAEGVFELLHGERTLDHQDLQ
jgi:hypothetical protein